MDSVQPRFARSVGRKIGLDNRVNSLPEAGIIPPAYDGDVTFGVRLDRHGLSAVLNGVLRLLGPGVPGVFDGGRFI